MFQEIQLVQAIINILQDKMQHMELYNFQLVVMRHFRAGIQV